MNHRVLPAAILAAALTVAGVAQTAPAGKLIFSAITVKQVWTAASQPGSRLCSNQDQSQHTENPRRIRRCGNLGPIIQEAYAPAFVNLGSDDVPPWLNVDGFDIEAVTDAPTDHATKMRMMQAALEEHFHLKLRADTREMPVLALIVAPDGPKFSSASPSNAQANASGPTSFRFRTMADLVARLNRYSSFGTSRPNTNGIDKPVVDETELAGEYDLQLALGMSAGVGPGIAAHVNDQPNYPGMLHSQLGLQLVSKTELFTVYTIESVVEPRDNDNE